MTAQLTSHRDRSTTAWTIYVLFPNDVVCGMLDRFERKSGFGLHVHLLKGRRSRVLFCDSEPTANPREEVDHGRDPKLIALG
jgi:hypothetical protein